MLNKRCSEYPQIISNSHRATRMSRPLPGHRRAALNAIKEGGKWTHYSTRGEIPEQFKQAVVDYYTGFGSVYEPKNVVPTAGSSAALYISLASVLEEGDEILMWSPSYRGHYKILDEMGVKVSVAPLKRETGYHPDLDTL